MKPELMIHPNIKGKLIALLESGHRLVVYPPPDVDDPSEYLIELARCTGDRLIAKRPDRDLIIYRATYPAEDYGRQSKDFMTAEATIDWLARWMEER